MGTQAVAAAAAAASHGGGGGGGGRRKPQGLQGFSAQSPIYGFDEFLHTAIPPSAVAGGAEMTLEGFLMKVGATAGDGGGDEGANLGRGALSGGYVGRAGPARQLSEAAPQALRRKRGAGTAAVAVAVAGVEEVAEKTVERRQKRMIKNRESAARSRARKQAYTHELENKVSRLEEENERLKRQKELEPVIHFVPQPEPKHQLRRTSSALF
ncbi:ABSCISIC ACID-INSENSITIVE 5-like protein 2 [Ananas comosus]|uniref:ABSCISIC ACID-INSENSITIVE 5-like protein 2 n=1 Tax=Ananas comosus TaxID=4615 RepID=A0A6P5F280_ANACO|nr:ABSCISIC ACID-INSENSITIVE 5-like protein 2 [Ananas comosus]XP_020087598.1 ABSCISIC ACID-INSENSITIVE 5-like protein 2 [Ananas comosus]